LINDSSKTTLQNNLFEDFVKNDFNDSIEKLPTLLKSRYKFMQISWKYDSAFDYLIGWVPNYFTTSCLLEFQNTHKENISDEQLIILQKILEQIQMKIKIIIEAFLNEK
jgi:hypothetical protein